MRRVRLPKEVSYQDPLINPEIDFNLVQVRDSAVAAAAHEPNNEGPIVKRNLSILCVDDSTYNLFVINELLKQKDPQIEIDSALNGKLALDKILEKSRRVDNQPYDIIFLDLHMPVLDGYKVKSLSIFTTLLDCLEDQRAKRLRGIRSQQDQVDCGFRNHVSIV